MKEAKKRNPAVQLWALPWAFPGWLDPSGKGDPYADVNATAAYVAEWVEAARVHHHLAIDRVGSWNERAYSGDYLKALRRALDTTGSHAASIIAPDGASVAQLAAEMLQDEALFAAVDVLSSHYPGGYAASPQEEEARARGKPLFASEDYGVYYSPAGGKALARLINMNYLGGNHSGTVAWNLVSSYYAPYQTAYYGPAADLPGAAPLRSLPFRLCGLMHAAWPWSGHYTATPQLFAMAHTTQFARIGYTYLPKGSGSGALQHGGSYVTLVGPTPVADADARAVVVVIEKMSWPGTQTAWKGQPAWSTRAENVTLRIPSHAGAALAVWTSHLPATEAAAGEDAAYMARVFVKSPADVRVGAGGDVHVHVCVDCLITLTTDLAAGTKGAFAAPPPASGPFPLPYADSFNTTALGQEPDYFADQSGAFEAVASARPGRGTVMRQQASQPPIKWGTDEIPFTVIGNSNWTNTKASVSVMLEADGEAWLGARLVCNYDPRPPGPNPPAVGPGALGLRLGGVVGGVVGTRGGAPPPTMPLELTNSSGVFLRISTTVPRWTLSFYPRGAAVASGPLPPGVAVTAHAWHRLTLEVAPGNKASGWLGAQPLFEAVDVSGSGAARGFAAVGLLGYYHAQFDDFAVEEA